MNSMLLVKDTNILTTGDEDHLIDKLLYAIKHATEIDIAVSFIKCTGLKLMLSELKEAIEKQKDLKNPLKLRILTSNYLHITEPNALKELLLLQDDKVEIKIFETATNESFHMKAFIFVHANKNQNLYEGSAFIGSNNISEIALTNGHEWCLRHDYKAPKHSQEAQQFNLIKKSFEKIFNHNNAKILTDQWIKNYEEIRQPPTSKFKDNNFLINEEEKMKSNEEFKKRPTLTEFYCEGKDTKQFNENEDKSWFMYVTKQYKVDPQIKAVIALKNEFLFYAVQKTSIKKSFKMILLEAFLQLDGFRNPPTLEELAKESWSILKQYNVLWKIDLEEKEKTYKATDNKWLKFWEKNPIQYSIKADKETQINWFIEEGGKFKANFDVAEKHINILHYLVQELVDYRLAKYTYENTNNTNIIANDNLVELPYYPNIKIACGNFKTGYSDDREMMAINVYNADPKKHFLARASGNSMNGGKNPIKDGDLLLLELISTESAGFITGTTIVIENQDETGDDQYLLRVIEKDQDKYYLKANNPAYPTIPATENYRTLARFNQVIKEKL